MCLEIEAKSLCVCSYFSLSASVDTVCIAECAVIYVEIFSTDYFQRDGMNCPLQVSADCLVLHVHLQDACIDSIYGVLTHPQLQKNSTDKKHTQSVRQR